MFTVKTDSAVKETLACICSSCEWCYGVFWGFHQMNSLFLTLKDAHFEQHMEALADDMLLQVHVLGGGEIGQTALSQNHRWIYSDAHLQIQDHQSQFYSEFFSHFTLGIKTIALISVEPWGVVQFGSTKKIPQTNEFPELVRQWLFEELNEPSQKESQGLNNVITGEQTSQQYGLYSNLLTTSEDDHHSFEPYCLETLAEFFRENNRCYDFPEDTITSTDDPNNNQVHSSNNYGVEALEHSGTRNSLFSRLGIDRLLDGNNDNYGGSFSSKKQKIDDGHYSRIRGQEKAQGGPTSDRNPNGRVCENEGIKREAEIEEQQGSITTEINGGKKRAKSSSGAKKPRPKDRQMIQDRLAELRKLVPNGEKMSIDRLLERTIRHLNYLKSLTKNAEILRKSEDHRKPRNDVQSSSAGATWACEVGGNKSSVCPLIVEDILTSQGQLLIEILYEERWGFFLEIVSVLRSLGLVVLKGVMEDRGNEIWARFIVDGGEGNRRATRHEIFTFTHSTFADGSRK